MLAMQRAADRVQKLNCAGHELLYRTIGLKALVLHRYAHIIYIYMYVCMHICI